MRNVLLTWPLFDLLHGEEILVVLQHLGEIAQVRRHSTFHSYSSQNFPSTCDEEFSHLLGASQSAANIAFHINIGKRNIQYTAKFCFADRKPFLLILFSFLNHFLQSRTRHNQYFSF